MGKARPRPAVPGDPRRLAGLYGERPIGRLAQLAKITGRKLDLVVDGGETANQLAAGYLRRVSSE